MKFTQGLAALALVASLVPDVALAANPGFCQHYAGVAVRQFHQAIEHGCIGGPDLRWNGNWDGHYSWCLGADYGDVEHETASRGHRLHEC